MAGAVISTSCSESCCASLELELEELFFGCAPVNDGAEADAFMRVADELPLLFCERRTPCSAWTFCKTCWPEKCRGARPAEPSAGCAPNEASFTLPVSTAVLT